ncbi:trehalose operon repressor [Leuconostoc litchii]|uniref:Trehalose operon repressor n=1 Tax=Leuconostoc litchii TaxID=1981069 RepID=A0A6P2CQL9_9LACO|nr:trehalose operon repressor [Leuconostoc litchii]TYC47412.1 trehalose operon repressor [Leuconostoc litchii]GMA69427.1 trehalose operon repressor [Leuconostoc litchii]
MIPLYFKIYQQVKDDISNNVYPANSFLPSENELVAQFHTSRDTIRKALAKLDEEGLIQKRRGKGSQVISHQLRHFPISGLTSFHELKQLQKFQVVTEVPIFERITVTTGTKNITLFPVGTPLFHIVRVRIIDGIHSVIDEDYIRSDVISNLTKDIAQHSIYEYIEKSLNLSVAYAEKTITAQLITNRDRELLVGLPEEENRLIQVESQGYLADTTYFQHTIARHRPDQFQFDEFARRQTT